MLTLRYNEPVFILMLRGRVGCLRQPTDVGDFKHELLNLLRSTMAVNVLRYTVLLLITGLRIYIIRINLIPNTFK